LFTLGKRPQGQGSAIPKMAIGARISNFGVILEHGGQPVAVVLSYEEFKKLQAIRADEEQRIKLGWWGLERLLAEIHRRPSGLSPEEIEAEITAARLRQGEGVTR
jgi:hypothetical protein